MRSRKKAGASGDEGRQVRRQLVIEAVATASMNPSSIFGAVEDTVKTDLSLTELNAILSDYKAASKMLIAIL